MCIASLLKGLRNSGLAVAAWACTALPDAAALTISDDFSDLNDAANPAWVHLEHAAGTTGQTWDASSGAYRMLDAVTTTFGSTVEGIEGYGFVGSYVNQTFTDVRVTVDIVDFLPPDFLSSNFAVAARLNGADSVPTPQTGNALRGYSYQYEGTAAGGSGEMVLTIIYAGFFKDVGSFRRLDEFGSPLPLLEDGKDYRVVFEVIGNTLHGQLHELDNLGQVAVTIADQFRDLDANPPDLDDYDFDPNTPDEPFVPYTDPGFSGVYAVGHVFTGDADVTIDNFITESVGAAIPGDFDADGDVDGADLAQWNDDYGLNGDSDADDDNDSDGADFLVWQTNLGEGSAVAAAGAVPEPATIVLVGFAAAVAVAARQRRCGRRTAA